MLSSGRKIAPNADMLVSDPEDVTARTGFDARAWQASFEGNIEITRIADRFRQVASFAERLDAEQIQSPMFDTIVQRKGQLSPH